MRSVLPVALLGLVLPLAGCLHWGDASSKPDGQMDGLGLDLVADGLDDLVFATTAGDGSGRLFFVEQDGTILVWKNGHVRDTPFLDVGPDARSGGERGLLGLAFHPGFVVNGRFFLYYTADDGAITIAEHHAAPGSDVADGGEGRILLSQPHAKYANHNGGMLAFGPDGYLYAGLGDGGAAGDPDNNAQDLDSLLGKLLRLDVDHVCVEDDLVVRPVCSPQDNPFVGRDGRDEIWAYGLRNPWRFSFDRATGDLWIGDVGQGQWEEIDYAPAGTGAGANYGWSRHEGTHDYEPGRSAPGAVDPVAEYAHKDGGADQCSVTGGYVYRGAAIPELVGKYVFGDFCSGMVWTLHEQDGEWVRTLRLDLEIYISSFGEDADGELLVVDHDGAAYRLVAAPS